MNDNAQSHNVAEIRNLLTTAFDDVGLVALCQDEFPELCDSLGRGLRKDEIVNVIMDYFRRRKNFAPLLAAIKKREPEPHADLETVSQKRLFNAGFEGVSSVFTQYEVGLVRLLEQLGKEHSRYTEALTIQTRLLENIRQARLYGDHPASSAERARIVGSLNRLAMDTVGKSFNELCGLTRNEPVLTVPHAVSPELYFIWQPRLRHLADHIARVLDLLNGYEEALLYTDDPLRQVRYRWKIKRLRKSATRYQREYGELRNQMIGEPPVAMQDVSTQLERVDAKLDTLLDDMKRRRQALLVRYKADEQAIIATFVERLGQSQLTILQTTLDALETDRLAEAEMHQTLNAIHDTLAALQQQNVSVPGLQEVVEAIEALTPGVKHKLKLTLPIIPTLLSYEGELELGGAKLKTQWRRLKWRACGYDSRLLLALSVVTALAFGGVSYFLANAWQLNVPQRLIATGVFCLAPAIALWVGFRWAHVSATKTILFVRIAFTVVAILFLTIGSVWATWIIVKPGLQVSPCLELDLVTGIGQQICPNDDGVLILPPDSLVGLQNLSGRAILAHANGYPCEWKGQTREGNPLTKLHGLALECNFSFELPEKPTTAYYLTLVVGEQYKLFIIDVEGQ